ncbi:MAG TPA: hypothetical protein PKA95_12485 [Thermomicrobiales bacterium]|nr:hypothetical protein [Thermomicrobiales bacterium]
MKTYVIFDRKTGEVLQTHVATDDAADNPDNILRMASPDATERAGVLEVDTIDSATGHRVDLKSNELVRHDKASGAGAAGVQSSDGDPRGARTVILRSQTQ